MLETPLEALDQITLSSRQGAQFIPLGSETPEQLRKSSEVLRKIRRERQPKPRNFWGTLGMADASPLAITGTLAYSRQGNIRSIAEESGQTTIDEIDLFYRGRPSSINESDQRVVIERFVSFKNVQFRNYPKVIRSWDDIPKLRLTVMLEQDEGALVYYQFNQKKLEEASADLKYLPPLEYIHPLPTGPTHSCAERDRLTYHIPIFPPRALEFRGVRERSLEMTHKPQEVTMLIKILVGKREQSESDTVIKRLNYHIFGRTHQLLRWNPKKKYVSPSDTPFEPIEESHLDLAVDTPTLFLIHGTFSNTNNAFNYLIKPDGSTGTSWMDRLAACRVYEQIIAFDHPTLGEGPDGNTKALLKRLPTGFSVPMNILTTSRGGLVGKWIAQNVKQFTINRAALVAGANGVGYFDAGWKVSKFLSIYKALLKGNTPLLALITGLAQHSADWFMKLPGCRAMTPGSDLLKNILTRKPLPRRSYHHQFLTIAGDFTSSVVDNQPFWTWAGVHALDVFLKFILGKQHDMVVGTKEQLIHSPGKVPTSFLRTSGRNAPIIVSAVHTEYLKYVEVQKILMQYLSVTPRY